MPVVNQTAQQQASQYSHAVQMVQSHTMHPIAAPILLNTPLQAQMVSIYLSLKLFISVFLFSLRYLITLVAICS